MAPALEPAIGEPLGPFTLIADAQPLAPALQVDADEDGDIAVPVPATPLDIAGASPAEPAFSEMPPAAVAEALLPAGIPANAAVRESGAPASPLCVIPSTEHTSPCCVVPDGQREPQPSWLVRVDEAKNARSLNRRKRANVLPAKSFRVLLPIMFPPCLPDD